MTAARDIPSDDARPPIAILGVGNALLSDDAFGPCTLRALERGWDWPPEVELIDVGTAGFDLTMHLVGRRRVVLLDAVRVDGAPGTLVEWDRAALLATPLAGRTRLLPHEPGIREALATAELMRGLPDAVVLVGAVPASTGMGTALDPAVVRACGAAADRVVAIVTAWGHPPADRAAGAPDLDWWRAPLVGATADPLGSGPAADER